MFRILGELIRGSTFYYKQLNLFLLAVLIVGGAFFVRQNADLLFQEPIKADIELETLEPGQSLDRTYRLDIDETGQTRINGKKTNGLISFEKDAVRLLWVVFRDATDYRASTKVTVHLPKNFQNIQDIEPRTYAIHGIDSASYRRIDGRTLEFFALNSFPGSTFSIELTFPPNYFQLSTLGRLRETLAVLTPQAWIALGVVLPTLSLLFVLSLIIRRWLAAALVQSRLMTGSPPTNLPPAVLGSLYSGKIGRCEITATLLDLAQRGFITIHQSSDGTVVFGKDENLFSGKATQLRAYEVFLLHQIFGQQQFSSRSTNIESGLDEKLFNSRVAMTLLNIYDAAVGEGFFIVSPNQYYLRYRTVGIVLFFFGLIGLLYGAFFLPEPAYVLFLWSGMIVASLLGIVIVPGIPPRTRLGTKTLKTWMGFRRFLMTPDPIHESETKKFFDFLPYAIVLRAERDWAKRWQDEALILPSWFSSAHTPRTADDYSRSILTLIDYLSNELVLTRPPTLA